MRKIWWLYPDGVTHRDKMYTHIGETSKAKHFKLLRGLLLMQELKG